MYEQGCFKYILYVEGHCAANRYAFLMRLGSVVFRQATTSLQRVLPPSRIPHLASPTTCVLLLQLCDAWCAPPYSHPALPRFCACHNNRVDSACEASEMWFFPLLEGYGGGAENPDLPVEVDGADHILIAKDCSDLRFWIEWARTRVIQSHSW